MAYLKFKSSGLWILASCVVAFANEVATAQQSECVQSCMDLAFENTGCAKSAWICACNTNAFSTQANACLAECQGGTKDVMDIINSACNIAEGFGDMVPFASDDGPVQHQRDASGSQSGALGIAPLPHRRALLAPMLATTSSTVSTTTGTTSSSTQTSSSEVPTTSGSSTSRSNTQTTTSTQSTSSTRSTSSTSTLTTTSSDSDTESTSTRTRSQTLTETTDTTVAASTTSSSTIPTLSALSPIVPSGTRPISSGSIAQLPTVTPPLSSATGIHVQEVFWIGIAIVAALML